MKLDALLRVAQIPPIMDHTSFDVVIAGGGLAGVSVAAALREFGYRILLVEPGLDNSKRLAGELIHPPGTTDLEELGLLPALEEAGGHEVLGFAVFPEKLDRFVLGYEEIRGLKNRGLAMEHASMTRALLAAAEKMENVTVWMGARVSAVDVSNPDFADITVLHGKREVPIRAQLLVAADGRTSSVRKLAGINDNRQRISHMVGFVLEGARLPQSGYGHIFVGGPAPALAYQIADNETRVMFDIPDNPHGVKALEKDPAYLDTLPEPFRSDVRHAMETQTALVSANYSVTPDQVIKGRLVCAGDAGGCCHPLTATGISVTTRDAIRLRQALRETQGDIPTALRRYSSLREGPNRTRVALAEALYEAFTAHTPEMHLLRLGLLKYWERSSRGRAASMALLSTHEGRMSAMARQYARVVGYAIPELLSWGKEHPETLGSRRMAVKGLLKSTVVYAKEAARGYLDGFYLPRSPKEARQQLRLSLHALRTRATTRLSA